jgi:hypothetical protein
MFCGLMSLKANHFKYLSPVPYIYFLVLPTFDLSRSFIFQTKRSDGGIYVETEILFPNMSRTYIGRGVPHS